MTITDLNINKTPVYLVGDLSAKSKELKQILDSNQAFCDCIFIFLGNMNFRDAETAYKQFEELDDELYKRNIKSYIIRGNRDNPELWEQGKHKELWHFKFRSFHPIDSNTRININGNKGIIISGATTIHNDELIENVDYWPRHDGIDLPPNIEDYGEGLKELDFIIGHTGPIYNDILKEQKEKGQKYLKDGFLIPELENEQKVLRKILRRYRPKRWYCGHYHFEKDIRFVWDNWSDNGSIRLRIVNENQIMRIA